MISFHKNSQQITALDFTSLRCVKISEFKRYGETNQTMKGERS